jgi:hypothetical protein
METNDSQIPGSRLIGPALPLLVACVLALPGWMPARIAVSTTGDAEAIRRHATETIPTTLLVAQSLKQGRIPVWNPEVQLGVPLVGSGHSAILFPTILLHVALPPTWSWRLSAVVLLWIAGLGAWMLSGRYGVSTMGRIVAGVGFMWCAGQTAALNDLQANVVVLLPWALVATELLMQRATAARMLLAVVIFAIQFLGGHLAGSCALLLSCILVWLLHCFLAPQPTITRGAAIRALLPILGAMAGGFLLAGAQWIPFIYNTRQTGLEGFIDTSAGEPRVGWWIGGVAGVLAIASLAGVKSRSVLLWLLALIAVSVGAYRLDVTRMLPHFAGASAARNTGLEASAALAIAILAGLGFDVFRTRLPLGRLVYLAPGLVIAELLLFSTPRGGNVPANPSLSPDPATAFLQDMQRKSTDSPFRVAGITASSSGLHPLAVSSGIVPARVADWIENVADLSQIGEPALRLLGLRYVVTPANHLAPPAPWKPIFPSTQPTSRPSQTTVYENPEALPRFWLAGSPVWSTDPAAILPRVKKMDFDPRRIVLLDRRMDEIYLEPAYATPGLIRTASGTPTRAKIEVIEQSPGRLHLGIQNASGWLVMADSYVPGWRARMSFVERRRLSRSRSTEKTVERDAIVAPAYGALLAVPLQPSFGQELDVVVEYFPLGWRYGLIVSALGGIVLVILICATLFSANVPTNRIE